MKIFSNLFFNLIILFLFFKNVISQTCIGGYTYVPGSGCLLNNAQITTAQCTDQSIKSYVRIANGANQYPCSAGETENRKINTALTTQFTLYQCQYSFEYTIYWYYIIGSCIPGDSIIGTPQTIVMDVQSRYIVISYCVGMAFKTMYIEKGVTSTSQTIVDKCLNENSGYINGYSVYDYSTNFICPIGYGGPLPCSDIDECSSGTSGCSNGCVNTNGGFYCTCPSGYQLDGTGKTCVDINECTLGTSGCSNGCVNTGGSFYCTCPSGYQLDGTGKTCVDINECTLGTSGCSNGCVNTGGSFYCTCPSGYQLDGTGKTCVDINECTLGTSGCSNGCVNTGGSFYCTCPSGYQLDGTGKTCVDINECTLGTSGCSNGCVNTGGSFYCTCPSGYQLDGTGKKCVDTNECTLGTSGCSNGCVNTDGSFYCTCPSGYQLDGTAKKCVDINECTSGTSGCSNGCVNTGGSFYCTCPSGYQLDGTGKTCKDINECTSGSSGCSNGCTNTDGSFYCTCPSGYQLDGTGKTCEDIDECLKPNKCIGLSTCKNFDGGYNCTCPENYHLISNGTDCGEDSDFLITSFKQKPNSFYTFVLQGSRFPPTPTIKIGNVQCTYISGNDTYIECNTPKGYEIIGEVIVQDGTLVSNNYQFNGAPFITGYSDKPSTEGGLITLQGNNFPTMGSISIKINSKDCPITSNSKNQIVCSISEGTGKNNLIELKNEFVSNTDSKNVEYSSPFIISTSEVYTSGGILTINGTNFGDQNSKIQITIGSNKCSNIVLNSHNQLTCQLNETKDKFSQILILTVDELHANDFYFTYSTLESNQCELNCNNNGKCTKYGCLCDSGYTGISCNETSTEIITKPSEPDLPIIEIGKNNDTTSSFGYKISILKIEEININQLNISTFELLNFKWTLDNSTTDKWVYNITLPNKSDLECTFEYFKYSKNITFANEILPVPEETLKLSFKTVKWPFESKLNTLRIIVDTSTLLLNENTQQCSINKSPNTYELNQNLWFQTKNSESGIVSRFTKYASIDNKQVIANIQPLESNSRTSTLISISVPYFKNTSLIDPDFGKLINMGNEKTGDCNNSSKTNYRVAAGVSVGVVVGVAAIVTAFYLLKIKKSQKSLLNLLKGKQNN